MAIIDNLRQQYHVQVCSQVIFSRLGHSGDCTPNMADGSNVLSRKISLNMMCLLPYPVGNIAISPQTAGSRLEVVTMGFLEEAFRYLHHIRPGEWKFSVHNDISNFEQYRHLGELARLIKD